MISQTETRMAPIIVVPTIRAYGSGNTQILSFVPLIRERSLVKWLSVRAYIICSDENLIQQLHLITSTPQTNGYPKKGKIKFQPPHQKWAKSTAESKKVMMEVLFKGDDIGAFTRRQLKDMVEKAYRTTSPRVMYTCWPMVLRRLTKSICIYRFTYLV